jgi:hypothetical protein
MKAVCGTAEVKLFGYGDKVAKMTELNVSIHTLNIIIETNKILDVWVKYGIALIQFGKRRRIYGDFIVECS